MKTRTLSLSDLVATSDDPGGLLQTAATTLQPMQAFGGLRFDIWTEASSGAGVAIPTGATLRSGHNDCAAQWADGALTLAVTGVVLREEPQGSAWQADVQRASMAFEQEWAAEFLPYLTGDPRFSYSMAQERRGGMTVNRKFFMGQKPDGRPPYAVFESLMAKGKAFLGISVTNHRYVPAPLLPPEQFTAWVAAAFAVHLSTFPPGSGG